MGMFDNVSVNYPLPDAPRTIQKEAFQTKAFGDGFTGGFLDNYTVTEEGKLILHKELWETVPEEKRPYYGKPEWKNPINQIMGSMKSVPVGDEVVDFHGILNVYVLVAEIWYEYDFEFTNGKVTDVKRIYREFGK